jgi:hypothetical protein
MIYLCRDRNRRRLDLEIKIKRLSAEPRKNDNSSDAMETYKVVDGGREFEITLKSHRHGSSSLAVVGLEGTLYTDSDTNTVRRQVITVGRSCGVTIDADELVEGLSVLAIKGIILANRTGEIGEIAIIVNGLESSDFQPVVMINGLITDLHQSL